jgi:predicted secreted protein
MCLYFYTIMFYIWWFNELVVLVLDLESENETNCI